MKNFGAHIVCRECGAQPYPDNPTTTRETFDLMRVGENWLCERCRPAAQKRAPRPVAASPLAALTDFENVFQTEGARMMDTIEDYGDDLEAWALDAFRAYSAEISRALSELRKALAPQKPPASLDDAPKSRSAPKKIRKVERLGDGQVDWVSGDAQPAGEDAR